MNEEDKSRDSKLLYILTNFLIRSKLDSLPNDVCSKCGGRLRVIDRYNLLCGVCMTSYETNNK